VLSDGGAVACGAVGAVCNANNECTSGYCKGAAATGGCTTDAICSCQLKPNGAACATSAECMAGICLTAALAPCTVDASCTCHAGG
jgi:hypothetical protein